MKPLQKKIFGETQANSKMYIEALRVKNLLDTAEDQRKVIF